MTTVQDSSIVHHVETPSGRIAYGQAGSGPVALFVHGVVLNKYMWRRQLDALSDIRRCITVGALVGKNDPGREAAGRAGGGATFLSARTSGRFQ